MTPPPVTYAPGTAPKIVTDPVTRAQHLEVAVHTARATVLVRTPLPEVRAVIDTQAEFDDGIRSYTLWQAAAAVTTTREPEPEQCQCPSHTASRVAWAREQARCRVCELLDGRDPHGDTETLLARFIDTLDDRDRALLHRGCPHRHG
jgi:hypothetical protein